MPNQIEKEQNLANQKLLKPIKGTNIKGPELVELSLDNVAIVEAMRQNDSAYIKSGNPNAVPIFKRDGSTKYGGSTAYWMTKLKSFLEQDTYPPNAYRNIISETVKAVDRDNSTRINTDHCGREEITNRISNILPKDLIKRLKTADLELVNIISARTSAQAGARVNLSFASKFCHYACFYLFEGLSEQDNYSIYDNIVKKALPLYADYYKLTLRSLDDYGAYQKAIDDIIAKSNSGISRNGFDHLLWYYFKGRI